MLRQDFLNHAAPVYHATRAVLRAVPADKLEYAPRPDMLTVGQLARHISGACGGALQYVTAMEHPPMREPMPLMPPEAFESSDIEDALARLDADERLLREIVMGWTEEEFREKSVQAPWSPVPEKAWEMCLGMLAHLRDHKMQMFLYLRILGCRVNTWTLYGAG